MEGDCCYHGLWGLIDNVGYLTEVMATIAAVLTLDRYGTQENWFGGGGGVGTQDRGRGFGVGGLMIVGELLVK